MNFAKKSHPCKTCWEFLVTRESSSSIPFQSRHPKLQMTKIEFSEATKNFLKETLALVLLKIFNSNCIAFKASQMAWPKITYITKLSTSDNVILAFSLIHWISVTMHYTCVDLIWKRMQQMSLSIKFFAESEVSSTTEWMKKSRFGELSTEEIQEFWTMPPQ